MAKIYGGRWQIVADVGRGGQGEVFEVKDLTDEYESMQLALKRVINPNRHPRFRREVEAIKLLDHPNIIKLIAHSALEVDGASPEKRFLVMPLALGGDLSKRAALYKDNLDGTLIVARQIASALDSAHAAGIVHRDIKPQNILFTGQNNDVLLTDFGICFVRDEKRYTPDDEVVGPWAFMAPELEHGGALDVQPSADIYSLGKVIFFMISGGTVLPRERIGDAAYSDRFKVGGRYVLLEILLKRMICEAASRISDMKAVIQEIDRIATWDERATVVPFSDKTRNRLAILQRDVLASKEVAATNVANAQAQRNVEAQVQEHLGEWLRSELGNFAEEIGGGGLITATVLSIPDDDFSGAGSPPFLAKWGYELRLGNLSAQTDRLHGMQLFFCTEFTVRSRVIMPGQSLANELDPIEDRRIAILPMYAVRPSDSTRTTQKTAIRYFFGENARLVAPANPNEMARRGMASQRAMGARDQSIRRLQFCYSQWPEVEATLRTFLSLCCDDFIAAVSRNKDSPFPT
jgi:hypothetical protein